MAEKVALKKIVLKTADGIIFDVDPAIAKEIQIVKSFLDADSNDASTAIPLPNVYSRELSRILDYCHHHHHRFRSNKAPTEGATVAKEYNAEFVKALSHQELKELIVAANYLNVKDLLNFLNQTAADLIQNKSTEFVRKFFGIENDYTPEEEAKFCEENAWAFHGIDED